MNKIKTSTANFERGCLKEFLEYKNCGDEKSSATLGI